MMDKASAKLVLLGKMRLTTQTRGPQRAVIIRAATAKDQMGSLDSQVSTINRLT